MNDQDSLYVSDTQKNEVRRHDKHGDNKGIVVAGGNGKGDDLNQLRAPTHLFVDAQYNIYISDLKNHRVMKWIKGAKEGIVVAGGNGEGRDLTQLSYPEGLWVDVHGNVHVADWGNHRVMRWDKGANKAWLFSVCIEKGFMRNSYFIRNVCSSIVKDIFMSPISVITGFNDSISLSTDISSLVRNFLT